MRRAATAPPGRPAAAELAEGFRSMQSSDAIGRLRGRRRPAFTLAAALVGLYLLNALLAAEVPDVMAIGVYGPVNIGLLLTLLQGVTTAGAAVWYGRYARASLDPLAEPLRESIEQWEGRP